ncbi:hypothetical protein C1I64_11600 [Rathayibacter festucae DSM 15932]|uniref:Uncharacterized protein n=1 Tax=Rathayibacter festucae DSM 15932 TaxID=1328866 RepID=A0A3T0T1X4_9MICO|nr:hypothetical protein C1I64_11600 [Rathayibacter festucae DSM 15932]
MFLWEVFSARGPVKSRINLKVQSCLSSRELIEEVEYRQRFVVLPIVGLRTDEHTRCVSLHDGIGEHRGIVECALRHSEIDRST